MQLYGGMSLNDILHLPDDVIEGLTKAADKRAKNIEKQSKLKSNKAVKEIGGR